MSFEALTQELDEFMESRLAKSEPVVEGPEDEEEPDEAAEDENIEDAADENEDEPMGKSFAVTLANGDQAEALDGTELLKAFHARIDQQGTTIEKALTGAVQLLKAQADQIDTQGAELQALKASVEKLSSSGRGRKSVVSVNEQPLQKSEPQDMTGDQFMLKALDAQKAGRLTALDVSIAENSLAKGLQIPDSIRNRVLV